MVWEQQILRQSCRTSPSLFVIRLGAARLVCPVRGETDAVPFLTDKPMHKTPTRTLTQTRSMLQNNTFVFILRLFLGFALPTGGLFAWAGCGSGCCRHPSTGRRSACSCTSSVRLVSVGRLLLPLLHKQDHRAEECTVTDVSLFQAMLLIAGHWKKNKKKQMLLSFFLMS